MNVWRAIVHSLLLDIQVQVLRHCRHRRRENGMRVNWKSQRICRTCNSNNSGTKPTKPKMSRVSKPSTSTNLSSSSTIGDDAISLPSYKWIQFHTMNDNTIKKVRIESRSNINIISYSNSKWCVDGDCWNRWMLSSYVRT